MEIPKAKGKLWEDPVFLRDMAASFTKSPVVYQHINNLIKQLHELLEIPPPTTNQAARDALKWRKDQASIEINILNALFLAPMRATQVLNAREDREKAIHSDEYSNWAFERTSE
jgi:hypothetical protein